MSPILIVLLMLVPSFIYCLVYGRRFSKPQHEPRSVLDSVSSFVVGWISINIPVIVAYSIPAVINDNHNASVVLAYLISTASLCALSVIILSYSNVYRYYRNTFV